MKKIQIIIVVLSVVVGLSVIITAYVMSGNSDTENSSETVVINSSDLAQNNGKNGNKCYVAINGVVYEINQGNKWKDGEHEPSEGLAYCGKDLSDVIDKAPHGSTILSIMTERGRLAE